MDIDFHYNRILSSALNWHVISFETSVVDSTYEMMTNVKESKSSCFPVLPSPTYWLVDHFTGMGGALNP
ncbi:hypothetical protein L1887_03040 [Cichorium endivia]|nr:hypothetical protein L1887_03040 [Cichorium endivia]